MPENSAFFPQVMQRYMNDDPLSGVDQAFIAALLGPLMRSHSVRRILTVSPLK
jgi:hypothetical protein